MKIIDLLVKKANGEKTPEYIEFMNLNTKENQTLFTYTENIIFYLNNGDLELNSIVSAVEFEDEDKEEDKDIEEISFNNGMKDFIDVYHELEHYNYKINELVKAVNELKKGK